MQFIITWLFDIIVVLAGLSIFVVIFYYLLFASIDYIVFLLLVGFVYRSYGISRLQVFIKIVHF